MGMILELVRNLSADFTAPARTPNTSIRRACLNSRRRRYQASSACVARRRYQADGGVGIKLTVCV
eukprot:CAMPEP_0198605350 /NCGR_PEP_ID=MMETSP1462-20131121/154319_1 /TAXON_ID=1333877 /ORGANISM="Brandtodinium nutriculum, Strain RCC3387" /LENGTH=64 /DNA_ID=CAMNT_0044337147 /DNA_START=282 /DNA_END=473 /DNA_ORIENTATION=+